MEPFECTWDEVLHCQYEMRGEASEVLTKILVGEIGHQFWDIEDPEGDQYRGHRLLAVELAEGLRNGIDFTKAPVPHMQPAYDAFRGIAEEVKRAILAMRDRAPGSI